MILTQRYYYISSYANDFWTIVLKQIGRRHKRLKIVLKWLVFYNDKTI